MERRTGLGGLAEHPEAELLLTTHGIPFVTSEACPDSDAPVAVAALGEPVALKADFPPPGHAGDVDAVLLGLDGGAAIEAGWRELERRVAHSGREWTGAIVPPLVSGAPTCSSGRSPIRSSVRRWPSAWLGARPAWPATSPSACSR